MVLRERLEGSSQATDQRADVAARWAIWREEKQRRLDDDRGKGVGSAAIFDSMKAAMQRGEINRALFLCKASLFLNRMTALHDGVSFLLERQSHDG